MSLVAASLMKYSRLGDAERGIHTCFLTHRLRNAATALVTLRGRIVVFMRASIGFYAEHGDLPMVPKRKDCPRVQAALKAAQDSNGCKAASDDRTPISQLVSRRVNQRRAAMDWNRVEGNWKQVKGKVKEQWGKLTDDDLDVIAGKQDQLEGRLQQRYGYAKDQAQKEVNDWYGRQKW
jgi:uncharacterized protein YjbJ (UPF0337 family)